MYWHIRKIVITHDNANDVLQNTFIRIFKGIKNFKENSTLHTWMFRIAYNESIRFLEKNKIKTSFNLNDGNNSYLENLTEDVYFDGDEAQLKLHTIISKRFWIALAAGYGYGGRSYVNDISRDALISTIRLGLTLAIPIAAQHSLKLVGVSGIRFKQGPDFDAISLSYQFRWNRK